MHCFARTGGRRGGGGGWEHLQGAGLGTGVPGIDAGRRGASRRVEAAGILHIAPLERGRSAVLPRRRAPSHLHRLFPNHSNCSPTIPTVPQIIPLRKPLLFVHQPFPLFPTPFPHIPTTTLFKLSQIILTQGQTQSAREDVIHECKTSSPFNPRKGASQGYRLTAGFRPMKLLRSICGRGGPDLSDL